MKALGLHFVRKIAPPVLVVAATAAAILATSTLTRAQSKTSDLKFEVASIRPAQSFTGGDGGTRNGDKSKGPGGSLIPRLDHSYFDLSTTLLDFIVRAYGVQGCGSDVEDCSTVVNAPPWIHKERLEIRAKAPAGTPDYTFGQFLGGKAPEIQQMLQTLLADRFNLKTHQEQRLLPVYVLTLSKKSANLKRAVGEMTKRKDGTMFKNTSILVTPFHKPGDDEDWTRMTMTVRNNSMSDWADKFSNMLGRRVLDRTGLQGEFDMDLTFDSDAAQGSTFSESFFSALNKQLGLNLESSKAELPVLVIDHIDPASEN